jgi:nucleoside-diphosphate-sugar epimerase
VNLIRCDRFDSASFVRHLREGRPWDIAVDFISFQPSHTQDVIDALAGAGVHHFIHISTISAYRYEPNLDSRGQLGDRNISQPHVTEEDMLAERATP